MKIVSAAPLQGRLIVVHDKAMASRMSRAVRSGRAVRLTSGIYVEGAELPIEQLARQHRFEIVANIWPDAVICDRSGLEGGSPTDGWLFVCHPTPGRRGDLVMPGLNISCRVGPGSMAGDIPLVHGLSLTGTARRLIENVTITGRPPVTRPSRAAGPQRVADEVDQLARYRGAGGIQEALAQLDEIAEHFDSKSVAETKTMLVSVLGTQSGGTLPSARLSARIAGVPFDAHRIERFEALVETLLSDAPRSRPTLGDPARWQWLPFFEAYFSNYIEGTEFPVDEARAIAIDGTEPADRPQDAHDVLATYRIVANVQELTNAPHDFETFMEVLRARHRSLMEARPHTHPGQLKTKPNYAGGYRFVDPELLEGTLKQGIGLLDTLGDPFHRCVFVMFLITECHPFDDGNGRIARIMANAELVAAGEVRIVIPTSYRNDYLAALAGMSGGAGNGESLISVLDYPRRWAAAIDWSTWDTALGDLEAANAFVDAGIAERTGRRLCIPPHH